MKNKPLYAMACAHLCNDINSGALPALLPFFVTYKGMDYTDIGGLLFASSFLASVIQPAFGYLADRTSKQWFMGIGIMMTGGFLGITGLLSGYWAIFAAVTFMGIGSSIFHPEAARLVNKISGHKKGQGMSIFSVGGNAGFGLGPLLAVALVYLFGLKGTLFFVFLSFCMGLLMLFWAPKFAKNAQEQQKNEEKVLKGNLPNQDDNATNDWGSFAKLTAVIIMRSVVSAGVRGFLPLFCIQILLVSHATGSATLSVLSILGIISTLIGGRIADRIGYARTLKLGCLLLVPVIFLLVYCHEITFIYLLLLPLSLAVQGTYAAFVVLGQSYLGRNIGFASGITMGLSFSAGGCLIPVLGNFADNYGIENAMWILVGISLMLCICSQFLPEPFGKKAKS